MALSRTEIELLIKARNTAQGAFDQLSTQVKKVTGDTEKATQAQETFQKTTQKTGTTATATGVAVGLLAERMARGLVAGFQETISAANRLDAGLIGLGATARAFGTNTDEAKRAAQSLAADGLMSVGEAASGLKNLLASGFNLPQAIELMNRFKDSAAFGRQGALEFGQAIVGATEGIKNGNSATADNAGLTKNLSNILVEAGKSASDLSKVQSDLSVRTALYNGILKETNPQLGNTALYLNTAAGKQAQFNSQVEIAQQKIGKALQPALAGMLDALTPLVKVIGDNATVLVPLAAAVAAVVAPLAAMQVAAALGIPSLTGLAGAMRSTLSVFAGVRSFSDARAGIQLVGEASGLTTKNLGMLGSAAAVAAAGFVGWQIGRVISDLLGLDKAIANTITQMDALNAARQRTAQGKSGEAAVTADLAAKERELNQAIRDGEKAKAASLQREITAIQNDSTRLAMLDVINKAISSGAAATVTYTQALEHNARIEAIRLAQFDKALPAQQKRIEAELALGRITQEQANAQLAAIEAEKQAQAVRSKRLQLTDAVAGAEKAFRAEIEATGYSQKELTNLIRTNEAGFDAWAKKVDLSSETIKRLKDSVKDGAAAAKKLHEAQEELRSSGDGWKGTLAGIDGALVKTVKGYLEAGVSATALGTIYHLTDTQLKAVAKSLDEETKAKEKSTERTKKLVDVMEELASVGDGWKATVKSLDQAVVQAIKGYLDAGVSQEALATAYGLTDAQIRAVTKSLSEEKKQLEITRQSQQETADLLEQHYNLVAAKSGSTADEQIANVERWAAREVAQLKQGDANWQQHYDAIHQVAADKIDAITNATRNGLSRQARDAERHYQEMAAIFGAHSDKAKEAHRQMVEAQLAEAGKVPSYWAGTLFPQIRDTVANIGVEVSHTFAEMLTGATSFSDGFKGIWQGIKKSVTDILGDILHQFLNSFLKGMLGAMLGQQGAFSRAFAGLFGGGGGGGFGIPGIGGGGGFGIPGLGGGGGLLGKIPGIGGLFGGGGAAAGIGGLPGTPVALSSITGGFGGGAGGAGGLFGIGGLTGAGLLGGLGAGGAGFGLGMLGGKLFGQGSAGAGLFGGGSGFATGALIGSIVPGIGTLIGGIIGGLSGVAGGLIGGGNDTRKQREGFAQDLGVKDTTELWKLLADKLPPALAESLKTRALTQIGKKDSAANATWMNDVIAALNGVEAATIAANKATDALTTQRNAAVAAGQSEDEVLKQQAGSYSILLAQMKAAGVEAPGSLQPVVEKLIEMGVLIDGNGNKITDLAAAGFPQLGAAASAAGAEIEAVTHKAIQMAENLDQQRKAALAAGQDEDTLLKQQAGSYSILAAQLKTAGAEIPASLQPILDKLVDMGLLIDGNGNKITSLADAGFPKLKTAGEDAMAGLMAALAPDEAAALGKGYGEALAEGFNGTKGEFFAQQLEFYDTLEEGDKRLKTFFYGSTIDAFEKIRAAGQEASRTVGDGFTDMQKRLDPVKDGLKRWAEEGLRRPIMRAFSDLTGAAESAADGIEGAFRNRRIRIPVDVEVNLPSQADQSPDLDLPEAAEGIYATGRSGVATWFGEGGEPEVGGPRSFFKRIFEELGLGGPGGLTGGGGDTFVFNVYTMSADGFKPLVENQILPLLTDAVAANRRGSRTNLNAALGNT